MRVLCCSDIHGNRYALEAFLSLVEGRHYDLVLCLGDIYGYYYQPQACLTLLEEVFPSIIMLQGNHDVMYAESRRDKASQAAYVEKYGSSYLSVSGAGDEGIDTYMQKALPDYYDFDIGLRAMHAGPHDMLHERVYPDTDIEELTTYALDQKPALKIVLMGHTHYAMQQEHTGVLFINPGSIGQPRDEGRPSFAEIEIRDDAIDCRLRRFDYTKETLITDIRKRDGEETYLEHVLYR